MSAREREWIEWILPHDRPGYNVYRELIDTMEVIGEGRRGKGEIILGKPGDEVDFSTPLAPVFAYGAIETNFGIISITMREMCDQQISVEIVSSRSDDVLGEFEESRRWTYSTWKPGERCPQCRCALREVSMHAAGEVKEHYVLALCAKDRRLWVYDESDQVNHLIPVTNYYNELMLHKNTRDPKTALDSKRLFTELSSYSDDDLTYAFLTYNKLKTKVHAEGNMVPDTKSGMVPKLRKLFSKPS